MKKTAIHRLKFDAYDFPCGTTISWPELGSEFTAVLPDNKVVQGRYDHMANLMRTPFFEDGDQEVQSSKAQGHDIYKDKPLCPGCKVRRIRDESKSHCSVCGEAIRRGHTHKPVKVTADPVLFIEEPYMAVSNPLAQLLGDQQYKNHVISQSIEALVQTLQDGDLSRLTSVVDGLRVIV